MIKFDKIEPGMVLLDIHPAQMGNTMMRELICYKVTVISVDKQTRSAMVSWNGNRPTRYSENRFKSLSIKPSKKYLAQQERRKAGGL